MNTRLLIAALVLTLTAASAHAVRIFEQPENAHEVALGDVRLPANSASQVIIKSCSDCDSISLRVSSTTVYFYRAQGINRQVTLKALLEAAEDLRQQDKDERAGVYVFFDRASKRVTRLTLAAF